MDFGKKILFPVGLANIDYERDRIHLPGFTKQQAENLPEYDDDITVDYDYEERVVVERMTPTDTHPIAPDATAFQEGEVFRMEVYEESANVQKQTFVREEVKIRKEIENETVEVQETIRREELDIDTDGKPLIDRGE